MRGVARRAIARVGATVRPSLYAGYEVQVVGGNMATSVSGAFSEFQQVVNAEADQVREARKRRDLFKDAFGAESDVNEVLASGSLARGTQKDPIHDVDTIVIFDDAQHADWGSPGESASEALDYTRGRVNYLLGATNGTHAQVVRLARWRNHAVKCFLDDPDDPNAFTVDAMPALRRDGMLLIPEAKSERWVSCDPESLIAAVAAKHAAWNKFAGSVRMLKWWAAEQSITIKPLVMEVLALQFLPVSGGLQPNAIKQFFISANYYIAGGSEVVDPAGVCGPIQGDLDYSAFGEVLGDAADKASRAMNAEWSNDAASAIRRWGELFGPSFPTGPVVSPAPALPPPPRPVKDTPQG